MYITDLDNTLLNGKGMLSEFGKNKLQQLIDDGVQISFATARSGFTSGVVLDHIKFPLPAVIFNGGAIIDTKTREYLYINEIKQSVYFEIVKEVEDIVQLFVIGTHNGLEIMLHKKPITEIHVNHLAARLKYGDKRQTEVTTFGEIDHVINLTFLDNIEVISKVEKILRDKFSNELTIYKYPKSKLDKSYYFLDVTSKSANKGTALYEYSKLIGTTVGGITCFGDDVNDVEMFTTAGRSVAVGNAIDAVKSVSTDIIGRNEDNSVVNFIQANEQVIEQFTGKLENQLDELVEESVEEGYNFVRRLRDEYINETNNFKNKGELLYFAYIKGKVVGVCGINNDPYLNDKDFGRVRHLYVLKNYRGAGLANLLLDNVVKNSKKHFKTFTLRTFNEIASNLYCKYGFTKKEKYESVTHYLEVE